MKVEVIERIEGLVEPSDITKLKTAIYNIANVMVDGGFEYDDIKEYIQIHLDENFIGIK
jgi:3-keto-L-gulonate-6-phosphate decarboxylase